MPQPLVSILIPCYNAEKYVGAAIDTPLAQTYKNIEVIAVDDGSTDSSVEVLKSHGDRIRFEAGPNRGACAARNRALELSRGEFVQFFDADDLLMSTKIERSLPFLIEDKADMVWTGARAFREGQDLPLGPEYPDPSGVDPLLYLLEYPLQTGCPLHRRRCLEAVGGFRPGLASAQEWDLHVRLGAMGVRMRQVPERLIALRDHEGPRITRQPRRPGFNLELLLTLARELEVKGQLHTPARREAFAKQIVQFSIFTLRSGEEDLAREGFRVARTLARVPHPDGRVWMRAMAAVFGHAGAEGVRAWANRVVHGEAPAPKTSGDISGGTSGGPQPINPLPKRADSSTGRP